MALQRFRRTVGQARKRLGYCNPGHFEYDSVEDANQLCARLYGMPAFPGWPSVRSFADTGERSGFRPLTFLHQEASHPHPEKPMSADNAYLARVMQCHIPYLPVAHKAEIVLVSNLFTRNRSTMPDFAAIAASVNQLANGVDIFLKRPAHISKFHTVWKTSINNAVASSQSKLTRPSPSHPAVSQPRSSATPPQPLLVQSPPPTDPVVQSRIEAEVAANAYNNRALHVPPVSAIMVVENVPRGIVLAPATVAKARKKETRPRQARKCKLCRKTAVQGCRRVGNGTGLCNQE